MIVLIDQKALGSRALPPLVGLPHDMLLVVDGARVAKLDPEGIAYILNHVVAYGRCLSDDAWMDALERVRPAFAIGRGAGIAYSAWSVSVCCRTAAKFTRGGVIVPVKTVDAIAWLPSGDLVMAMLPGERYGYQRFDPFRAYKCPVWVGPGPPREQWEAYSVYKDAGADVVGVLIGAEVGGWARRGSVVNSDLSVSNAEGTWQQCIHQSIFTLETFWRGR